jgi:long-subunit acyl-CoA synthetase (AMP-forming)
MLCYAILYYDDYTGTTGEPKGALLTHANLISDAAATIAMGIMEPSPENVYMSYLPLPHIFERQVSVFNYTNSVLQYTHKLTCMYVHLLHIVLHPHSCIRNS